MHTPGPWTAYNAHNGTALQHWRIGESNTTPGIVRPVARISNEDNGRSGDEQAANARLIAAAPTMLDTLDRIANGEFATNVSPAEQVAAMRDIARAAIANATA